MAYTAAEFSTQVFLVHIYALCCFLVSPIVFVFFFVVDRLHKVGMELTM